MDTGLLIARLVFGLVMAAHGTQKLFGWFGGYGLAGTGGFFEQLGFRPGRFFVATPTNDGRRPTHDSWTPTHSSCGAPNHSGPPPTSSGSRREVGRAVPSAPRTEWNQR